MWKKTGLKIKWLRESYNESLYYNKLRNLFKKIKYAHDWDIITKKRKTTSNRGYLFSNRDEHYNKIKMTIMHIIRRSTNPDTLSCEDLQEFKAP